MNDQIVIGLHLQDGALRQATLHRLGRSIEVALSKPPFVAPTSATTHATLADAVSRDAADPPRIACLPSHAIISRCWSFPKTDRQTLRRMVANRLEADLPLPADKITWDLRQGPHSNPDGTINVLVQAARSDQVERHMASLASAGQPASILTTEAEAVQALHRYGLKRPMGTAAEALVMALPQGWLVATLADGMVQSLRRLPAQPRTDLAVRECRQAIGSHDASRALQRVWWLASPELADARTCLAEQLKVPVELAEPADILVTAGRRLDSTQLAEYGLAIGLALASLLEADELIRLAGLRQMKLSPRRESLERVLMQPKRWAIAAAGLTLLAIVLHVGSLKWEAGRMQTVLAEADKAAAAARDFQPKLQAMQRLQTYRIDVEKAMAELAGVMPDTIVISSVQLSRESRMILKGTAKDPKAIFTLADALRKSKRFQGVNWDRAEPGQGGTFTISMEVAGVNSLNPTAPRGAKWR